VLENQWWKKPKRKVEKIPWKNGWRSKRRNPLQKAGWEILKGRLMATAVMIPIMRASPARSEV
jgi:hypothetical protein